MPLEQEPCVGRWSLRAVSSPQGVSQPDAVPRIEAQRSPPRSPGPMASVIGHARPVTAHCYNHAVTS